MGYTMRVQHIVEMFNCDTEHAGFLSVNKKIKNACPKIFNFEIDIYDPDHLLPLETKIIRHYYMRDICCETVGLWQLYLNQFFDENMEKYNALYKNITDEFNPLGNYNLRRQHTLSKRGDVTHKFEHTSDVENINKFSQTPQNGLQDLMDDKYLTNATVNTDKQTEGGSNSDINNTDDNFDEYTSGLSGVLAGDAIESAKKFETVDKMIITDMSDLFFGLWL